MGQPAGAGWHNLALTGWHNLAVDGWHNLAGTRWHILAGAGCLYLAWAGWYILAGWGALTLRGLGSITLPWMGGISLALGALTLGLDGIVAGLGHTHDAEPPPPGFSASPTFTSQLGSSVPRSRSPYLYNNGNMPVLPRTSLTKTFWPPHLPTPQFTHPE